jgi:hypothetical protein
VLQSMRVGLCCALFLAFVELVSAATAARKSEGSVVAFWHLNERGGRTVHDASGNGHDGSIRGFVTLGVDGVRKTAYRFEPQSNIVVRDAPDLRPGTADITVSYWLKSTAHPSAHHDFDIFDKGDQWSKGGQVKLEVQANGQASCAFRGALGGKQLQAGPNVINGRWHHVICRRIGDRIVETVDGRSYSVTKATGAIRVEAPVVLGSHHHKGDWYQGVLDEVWYAIDRD